MGFRDKMKSFFDTTETKNFPYVNKKEAGSKVLVGKVEEKVLMPQQTVCKEKRDELEVPLTDNELKWVESFQRKNAQNVSSYLSRLKEIRGVRSVKARSLLEFIIKQEKSAF
ncbi:hypothetical protein F6Y05_34785 [Bacillus megaterium]|nr:hypothetical protein [Priestia megaterium]